MLPIITALLLSGALASDTWRLKKGVSPRSSSDMVDDIFSRIIPKGCDNPEAHFPNTASLPGFPGVIKLSDQLIKKVNKPTFNPLKFGADKQDPFLANIAKSQKEMMDEMSGSMDLKPPIDEDDAKKDTVQIGGCKIVSEPKPVTEHFLERDSTANKHDAFDADNGNEIASVLESVRPMDDEFKNMEEKNFDKMVKKEMFGKLPKALTKTEYQKKKFMPITHFLPRKESKTLVTQRPLMPYCPLKSSQRRVIIHPSLPLRTALPGSNKLSRIPQRQSKTHISRNIRKSNVVKPLSAQKMPVIANKAKISVREAATRTVPKTVAIDRPRARKTVTYATKKVLKQSYRRDSQSMLSSAGTVNVPKTKLMNASNVRIVNVRKKPQLRKSSKLNPSLNKLRFTKKAEHKITMKKRLSRKIKKTPSKGVQKIVISKKFSAQAKL